MASLACIINGDDLNGVDDNVLKHNSFLLKSLMEETVQGEEYMYDDDQLDSIIRSLEAEIIHPNRETTKEVHDHDLALKPDWINDLNVAWDDMELMASDDLNVFIMDFNGDDMEMNDVVEFGVEIDDQYQLY